MNSHPNIVLRSGDLIAEISPLGAELQRLATVDGRELLWDGDPAFWTGRAPILFPIVGALREDRYRLGDQSYGMAKHGFARRSVFSVVGADTAAVTFRLEANAENRASYPFDFRLDVGFALMEKAIVVEATIMNLGEGVMPASFGFHPALRWPLPFGRSRGEHRLVFEKAEGEPIRRLDRRGLLTKTLHPTPVQDRVLPLRDELFVEDAVIFDQIGSRSVVYGAEVGPQVGVTFSNTPMLGLWSKPGAGFVCIEPWAGLADPEDFHGDFFDKPGVFVISSQEQRTFKMAISLASTQSV